MMRMFSVVAFVVAFVVLTAAAVSAVDFNVSGCLVENPVIVAGLVLLSVDDDGEVVQLVCLDDNATVFRVCSSFIAGDCASFSGYVEVGSVIDRGRPLPPLFVVDEVCVQ